jgi:hypothetical protein
VASRNFQLQIGNVGRAKLVSQPQRKSRFNCPLHEDLSRIALDIESGIDQLIPRAQIACELIPVEPGAKKRFDETSPDFQDAVATDEPCLREQSGFNALAGRSTGMGRLDHGSGVGRKPTRM